MPSCFSLFLQDRWYREWLEQQTAEHPPAISKTGWTPLRVWSVIPQSDNTNLVRFVFDDPFAAAGMDVASYLLVRAFIGKEKPDGTRAAVIRPYTPSHTTIGYLELVVKGYPEGKMSKHINSLKPGDKLDFKGPILGIPIIQNEFDSIGLIAGGSGITPMLQVRRATGCLLRTPHPSSRLCSSLHASLIMRALRPMLAFALSAH